MERTMLLSLIVFLTVAVTSLQGSDVIYVYDGMTTTTTRLNKFEDDGEIVGFRIRSLVHLDYLDDDWVNMQLYEVEWDEISDEEDSAHVPTHNVDEIEKNSIQFKYISGHVTSVKANPSELDWVLNMKRGIVSLLQVHYQDNHLSDEFDDIYHYTVPEVDVTGDCLVNYTVLPNKNQSIVLTIFKDRDPKECTKNTAIINCTIPGKNCRETPSEYESTSQTTLHLIKPSSINTKTNLDEIKEVYLDEAYVFNHAIDHSIDLFMVVESEIRQSLKLLPEAAMKTRFVTLPDNYITHGLTAENISPTIQTSSSQDSFELLDKLMKEYIREISKTGDESSTDAPRLFMEIVKMLRHSGMTELLHMFEKYSTADDTIRDAFMAVLSNLNSPEAVKLSTEQILMGTVNIDQAKRFLRGVALSTNPTKEMLNDIMMTALSNRQLKEQSLLTLGSMIHHFMVNHNINEASMPEHIQYYKNYLVSFLHTSWDKKDENNILTALKALMNAGFPSTVPYMMRCAKECPTLETRATAIYGAWNVPSQGITSKVINDLSGLFEDTNNPIEVRVAAFIMLMEAKPSIEVINRITNTLTNEQQGDLHNFMCSYLETTWHSYSSIPGFENRMDISYAALQRMGEKCPRDTLHNSFNTSFSSSVLFGNEALLDGHIIYDKGSSLPREVMLNLVNDIMGLNTNLFEIGIRMEGLEEMIGGLKGKRKREILSGILVDEKLYENVHQSSECKTPDITIPRLSLYVLALGQELYFDHKGIKDLSSLLRKLQVGQQVIYNETAQQHYSSLVVPTSLGFPLRIAVDRAVRYTINATTKINIQQSSAYLHIEPSYCEHTVGEAGVDGHVIYTAVKYNITNGFRRFPVNITANLASKRFDVSVHVTNTSNMKFEKSYAFASYVRRNSTGEEVTKMVNLGRGKTTECQPIDNRFLPNGMCFSIETMNGKFNLQYFLPSKDNQLQFQLLGADDGKVDSLQTKPFSAIIRDDEDTDCVSIGATEWSECYSELPCGKGIQYRTHQLWCGNSKKGCLEDTSTEEGPCVSCSCASKLDYIANHIDDKKCQSLDQYITCPSSCRASGYTQREIAYKCIPDRKTNGMGNESAVRTYKLTQIPISCVCPGRDCEDLRL
ncbi:vitellogenin-like [Saccoglossus kowalevskii]|uniref:Vitellogenin-like n=1 Tax=Saccoglossus kowalevskii TaxID=10224 RepID=A0ABM0MEJ9_SACKO|nr:PREDICTED: vitellogenin-like [Saccoglossus kowalevskii]